MTGAERAMLLLCCPLGDPEAHPLSPAQFRDLGQRVRQMGYQDDGLCTLTGRDLQAMGCSEAQADQILRLLDRETRLRRYLRSSEARGIGVLTRISAGYPDTLAVKLRFDAPRSLFYRGDPTLFLRPAVALVGSRHLRPENEAFARHVGHMAAQECLTLVTGGAPGADLTALNACLEEGGDAVVYVPDRLTEHRPRAHCLFVSEGGYDLPFSVPRALTRNHYIHAHASKTLAAQSTLGTGGTWQGCLENLRRQWSELYVFADGSEAAAALSARGAVPVSALTSLRALTPPQSRLF